MTPGSTPDTGELTTDTPSILCVGHVNWDITLNLPDFPDPDTSEEIKSKTEGLGGTAANTATVLSAFRDGVALTGSVGDDEYAVKIHDALTDTGVIPALVTTPTPTTYTYPVTVPDSDPAYLVGNEDVGHFTIGDIPEEIWTNIDHVHTTSFHETIPGEIAEAAAEAGKTVSMNPSQTFEDRPQERVLDSADVLIVNDREHGILQRRYEPERVHEDTALVVTHSAGGATVYPPGEETDGVTHPSLSVDVSGDTVGAGDTFSAAFLHYWLNNASLDACVRAGNAAGAQAVQTTGTPKDIDTDAVRDHAVESHGT